VGVRIRSLRWNARRGCSGSTAIQSGFLEISAPDVVDFDAFLDRRIDGLDASTDYY
jgi:hypothetical protein